MAWIALVSTGYWWNGAKLYQDHVGPDASIYLVYPDHVERWPRAVRPFLCS